MFKFTIMKKIVISILLFSSFTCVSQTIDTIINVGHYKSYVNLQLKEPVYVSYVLYRGGGECSRSNFSFKNDTELDIHNNKSYYKSGYDRGHLVNAEDFAYDCELGEKTVYPKQLT